MKPIALIIDDEPPIRRFLRVGLMAQGYVVTETDEGNKAVAIARRRGWHVETWHKADGGSQPLLPLGPFDHRGSARRGRSTPAARAGQARRLSTGGER